MQRRCFDGGPCEHALNGLPMCPGSTTGCSIEAALANPRMFGHVIEAAGRGALACARIVNRAKRAGKLLEHRA